jgi:hypothetical protein
MQGSFFGNFSPFGKRQRRKGRGGEAAPVNCPNDFFGKRPKVITFQGKKSITRHI